MKPVRFRSRLARWIGIGGVLEAVVAAVITVVVWYFFLTYKTGP